jgi:NADPH:quinone reductase-like Zn-dependent oxidoreductase
MIKSATASMFGHQQLAPAIKFQNRADLVVLKELVEAGKLRPVIDSTYPLSQTGLALGHVGEGHARGTVVINM